MHLPVQEASPLSGEEYSPPWGHILHQEWNIAALNKLKLVVDLREYLQSCMTIYKTDLIMILIARTAREKKNNSTRALAEASSGKQCDKTWSKSQGHRSHTGRYSEQPRTCFAAGESPPWSRPYCSTQAREYSKKYGETCASIAQTRIAGMMLWRLHESSRRYRQILRKNAKTHKQCIN